MVYQAGPFDSPHLYLQWGGTLPGGDEWSCGLRMASTGGGNLINDPALLASSATAVQAYHQRATTQIHPSAVLTFVKLNLIGVDGLYVADTTMEQVMPNVAGGGTGALGQPPNQVAWAISLTTGYSRGAAHRGRFYLPLPAAPLGADGRVQEMNQAQQETSSGQFITDLNATSANTEVAVFSRKLGAATHRAVTGVEVGRVLDTQRRRRNKLAEAY